MQASPILGLQACININECEQGIANCPPNSRCEDRDPGYICKYAQFHQRCDYAQRILTAAFSFSVTFSSSVYTIA
uniref:EGF-like calcium-binding domain-containing protein n=1 Tax=Parascaris equorum TaxID=6256 RepID=A0A914S8Z7_PAREQ